MPVLRQLVCASAVAALSVGGVQSVYAERSVSSEAGTIRVETIANNVEHPWGLALLPDGRFLVTERNAGQMRIGAREGALSEPIAGLPEVFRFEGPTGRSQGGLLHVAVHPQFAQNRMVYFSFSQPSERGAGTAVARGRLMEEGGEAKLADVDVVFTMNDHDSSGLHFGGRFAFHPESGALYIAVGDRRNMSRAQDAEDHAGSIVRVTDDGSVPPDNPFVKDDEKDDKVFSFGHRNVQAMAFDPKTGTLWVADHGPKGGDEINRVEAGKNYGWPFQTGGVDYSGAPVGKGERVDGMESPVHVFEKTVAPSGLAFYGGDMFKAWRGDMLIGALRGEALVRVKIEDGNVAQEEWIEIGRRIRDVQVAEDGAIWLLTEHSDGEILRLTFADEGAPTGEAAPERKGQNRN
jgi:aldose sugar dehydrogenase